MKKGQWNKKNGIYPFVSLILFLFIIVPVVTVFMEAVIVDDRLDFSQALQVMGNSENITTITNSMLLGVLVVLVSSLIATPLAFLLARTKWRERKWMDIILMIPFMTPPYISSMGWILFVQKRGLFQQMFPGTGDLSEKFLSLAGLTLVMSFHVFPFMTSILKNALLNLGTRLEESGAVCGGSTWYRLRKITLPLLTGNYAIGMLLVFVKTLSEYGTPATFGKRIGFHVFTTDIHRYATTSPIDFGKASALSSMLVSICLVMWYIQNTITSKTSYQVVGTKSGMTPEKPTKKSWNILGNLYLFLIIIVSIAIPYFSVITSSLIKLRGYGMAAGNFTFAHYYELITSNDKGIQALLTSFSLAIGAATIASIIGAGVVILNQKAKKWKKWIEMQALLPEMLPNIVFVIGLMLFWNKIYKWFPLYNTIGFMVLVYVILFLPFSIQYVSSAVIQIGENLTAAGKICGGSTFYVFRKITLPLIKKGILSGWMMIFIIVFRELVAASLISPPNVLTVSTFIVQEFDQGSVSVGMAMAVICVLLTTTALILLNLAQERKTIESKRRVNMLVKVSKTVRKKAAAGVSLFIIVLLIWNYTDRVFAKENMVPGYEVKFLLDNAQVLNEEHELKSSYQEIFQTGESYQTIGAEYADTDDLDFNEEGWINRIRIKEGKSKFELTYKKRYPITNGDIEAALTLANEEGFDSSDDNYEAEVDWSYQKMTLSIARDKDVSNSGYDDLELPSEEDVLALITDKIPGKLEDWKIENWGIDRIENARIYGPVYYKKYGGEVDGVEVDLEIWPITNQTTLETDYITELSFKEDSFDKASEYRETITETLEDIGILLHEDSLKTQRILEEY